MRCPRSTTRLSRGLAGLASLVVVVVAGDAAAHWTIASTLTAEDGARTFRLTLHYEILAGQGNPDEPLRICFWLERFEAGRFAPITRQSCERLTLKATAWRTLVYSVDRLDWLRERRGLPLARGQYRAVAVIGSDVTLLTRLVWGATEERKLLAFEIE